MFCLYLYCMTKRLPAHRSKTEVLLWFSVACFGVKVSKMFHHIIYSSVWVAEWPPFGK